MLKEGWPSFSIRFFYIYRPLSLFVVCGHELYKKSQWVLHLDGQKSTWGFPLNTLMHSDRTHNHLLCLGGVRTRLLSQHHPPHSCRQTDPLERISSANVMMVLLQWVGVQSCKAWKRSTHSGELLLNNLDADVCEPSLNRFSDGTIAEDFRCKAWTSQFRFWDHLKIGCRSLLLKYLLRVGGGGVTAVWFSMCLCSKTERRCSALFIFVPVFSDCVVWRSARSPNLKVWSLLFHEVKTFCPLLTHIFQLNHQLIMKKDKVQHT